MTPPRRRDVKLCGAAMAIMAAFVALHLTALDVRWLRRVELFVLDTRMHWRGPVPPGPETVIVLIDDRTIADLGRWPVRRDTMAQLIAHLHAAGAKAIGIDILFAEPEDAPRRDNTATVAQPSSAAASAPPPPRDADAGDAALRRAIGEAGNVVLPFTFRFGSAPASARAGGAPPAGAAYARVRDMNNHHPLALNPTGLVLPMPALASVAALGHVMVAYDVDGAPRYDYPAMAFDLDYYPSMAVRVAQAFLGVPWNGVGVELGRGIALGPTFVPTDPEMRLMVDYLGPAHTFPTHALSQVLDGEVDPASFAGRVVLIGANALGTGDTFQSPFTSVMPGVERLATIVDSILHERYIRRAEAAPWLEALAMLAAALALGLAMSRWTLAAATACALAMLAALAVAGQVALSAGLWVATGIPAIALAATFTALLYYRYALLDRERRHIRRAFQRYLAPNMVDRLVREERLPELGGELRELTVMFCDLRGFTALSEQLEPATLTRLANEFFTIAADAVLEFGGTVDKYLGDAIMALWNAPIAVPDHAALACRAALRILERVDELNATLARDDPALPTLAVGIGINTGPCTVGNFGSARRFDYSAIGDAVNVAARLQGESKAAGVSVLLGPETASRVPLFATLPLERVELRGRAAALEMFALIGDERAAQTPAFQAIRALHARLREAVLAGGRTAAWEILDELGREAPPAMAPMHLALRMRLAPVLR